MSNLTDALSSLLAGHPWTLYGEDLSGLVIHDGAPAPTQAAVDAVIATLPATRNTAERAKAIDQLATDISGGSKLTRAVLLVILDEINTIRTTAALNLTPRTVAQVKTAIQAKINSGSAD